MSGNKQRQNKRREKSIKNEFRKKAKSINESSKLEKKKIEEVEEHNSSFDSSTTIITADILKRSNSVSNPTTIATTTTTTLVKPSKLFQESLAKLEQNDDKQTASTTPNCANQSKSKKFIPIDLSLDFDDPVCLKPIFSKPPVKQPILLVQFQPKPPPQPAPSWASLVTTSLQRSVTKKQLPVQEKRVPVFDDPFPALETASTPQFQPVVPDLVVPKNRLLSTIVSSQPVVVKPDVVVSKVSSNSSQSKPEVSKLVVPKLVSFLPKFAPIPDRFDFPDSPPRPISETVVSSTTTTTAAVTSNRRKSFSISTESNVSSSSQTSLEPTLNSKNLVSTPKKSDQNSKSNQISLMSDYNPTTTTIISNVQPQPRRHSNVGISKQELNDSQYVSMEIDDRPPNSKPTHRIVGQYLQINQNDCPIDSESFGGSFSPFECNKVMLFEDFFHSRIPDRLESFEKLPLRSLIYYVDLLEQYRHTHTVLISTRQYYHLKVQPSMLNGIQKINYDIRKIGQRLRSNCDEIGEKIQRLRFRTIVQELLQETTTVIERMKASNCCHSLNQNEYQPYSDEVYVNPVWPMPKFCHEFIMTVKHTPSPLTFDFEKFISDSKYYFVPSRNDNVEMILSNQIMKNNDEKEDFTSIIMELPRTVVPTKQQPKYEDIVIDIPDNSENYEMKKKIIVPNQMSLINVFSLFGWIYQGFKSIFSKIFRCG